jgi:tetratricopeptide (TPR) repeat protein
MRTLEITEENPFEVGLKALATDRTTDALEWFKKAVEENKSPLVYSYFAYCQAKEDGNYREAVAICMDALKNEPQNPEIYLNLGRIYLMSGHKRAALRAYQLGLRYGKNPEIVREFNRLGRRQHPPLPFLPRANPLNKMLGKFMKKVGIR